MGSIYAPWNGTSSDQLGLDKSSLKSCQRDPYQNGCRHLAENFLGKPQFFCIRHMGTAEPQKAVKAEFWNYAPFSR